MRDTRINLLLDEINKFVFKLEEGEVRREDIIVSMPSFLLHLIKINYTIVTTEGNPFSHKIHDIRLFGCRVQYAYENKITVFNEKFRMHRINFYQIELSHGKIRK